MTEEDAKQVIGILLEAHSEHGECQYCAYTLLDLFIRSFIDFEELAEELYEKRFPGQIEHMRKWLGG